jgi:hypothetical protein
MGPTDELAYPSSLFGNTCTLPIPPALKSIQPTLSFQAQCCDVAEEIFVVEVDAVNVVNVPSDE